MYVKRDLSQKQTELRSLGNTSSFHNPSVTFPEERKTGGKEGKNKEREEKKKKKRLWIKIL